MSVAKVLDTLGRRGTYGGSWKKFFDYLKYQDTPESDVFFWAEELEQSGNVEEARELVREYLSYRKKYGRVGEFGIIGESEKIAERLGLNYIWDEG